MNKSDLKKARAKILIQDAMLPDLSFATRMACAFEAVYLHVVDRNKGLLPRQACEPMPDEGILMDGLERRDCSSGDKQLGANLLRWYVHQWELPPPPCSVEEAISWARRIVESD